METIRIYGNDNNRNDLCNILLSFSNHETPLGTEFVILQGVQIEPTTYATLLIDVDLSDKEVKKHFDEVLDLNQSCHVFSSMEHAIEDEKEWHEAYEPQADLFIDSKLEKVA